MAGPSIDQRRLDELVAQPSETLNVELKSWLDLSDAHGAAKVARAALAIRNRNGGFIVIGFDDKTLKPLPVPVGMDVVSAFHVDTVQGIVSQFAFEKFEVTVGFGVRDGVQHPIISIPEGVKTPVAAKADLFNPTDPKKRVIARGDVFFRTLESNGTPSTAVARPEDWKDIVEICFDNREADLGRFLRRQLASHSAAELLNALQGGPGGGEPEKKRISLKEASSAVLERGYQRYLEAIGGRSLSDEEKALLDHGTWSVGLQFEPAREGEVADEAFFSTVTSSNPGYTGWPVWLDSRGFRNTADQPYVSSNGWEALIVSAESGWMSSTHFDFMRFEPNGAFYLRRVLQDDTTPNKITPNEAFDPLLMIYRVAEVVAVALAIGKGLKFDQQQTRLGLTFYWTGLRGRKLVRWADDFRMTLSYDVCREDTITTFIDLPLDTAPNAIAPTVDAATKPLIAAFGGKRIPAEDIEAHVAKLLERRL
ncbi:ATP-binding protein [Terricaulis silvestris]|uniref:Divergent AAA domain protein n=1 Tax=Terricaulis silvestris TaxID=2686094 RepID=A0A6I6MM12_9CAUL|nr:ATP-binding protein [Terricaulis silvestris]QGZ96270.1 hypothetical protein DSM104635_03128 [Terricaulis silvestris]